MSDRKRNEFYVGPDYPQIEDALSSCSQISQAIFLAEVSTKPHNPKDKFEEINLRYF